MNAHGIAQVDKAVVDVEQSARVYLPYIQSMLNLNQDTHYSRLIKRFVYAGRVDSFQT